MAFWTTSIKAKSWKRQPDPEPPKQEPKAEETEAAPTPAPIRFRYRSPTDMAFESFSPYTFPIQLGEEDCASPAHLYWSIAFARHPRVLHRLRETGTLETSAERTAALLDLVNTWGDILAGDPSFSARRIHIMHGIQALKFAQHPELRQQLIATGDAPLVYDQADPRTTPGVHSGSLGIFAAYIGSPTTTAQGPFITAEDTFWGTDPLLDPEGKQSNHLGKILMDLRKRFKDEEKGTLDLCSSLSEVVGSLSPRA